MKKILFIFCMLTIAAVKSYTNPIAKDNTGREQTEALLNKEIQRHVFYPLMQQQNVEATVSVALSVQEDGTLKIIHSVSGNNEMEAFVVKQLETITLNKADVKAGEIFHYTFRFKRQA